MPAEIRDIVSKTILSEAKGYLDIGFTHSLNPYSGCAFACRYCYVREMPIQKFKEIPWGEWVDVKTNAAGNYRNEIVKLRKKNKPVHLFMSSATDPYQPIERKAEITRQLLETMIEHPPDLLQIQTRSPLVTRDLDLLLELNKKCKLLVSMTVETDRDEIRRVFAPLAPGISLRLKAMRELHAAGVFTQAAISPVLPFSPDFANVLKEITDRIWIDTLQIGDGAKGRRSERLGMPGLFAGQNLSKWYDKNIHLKVEKYFKQHFSAGMVNLSKAEAYPVEDN